MPQHNRGGYVAPHAKNFKEGTNAHLVFTFDKQENKCHRLDGFNFSYSANPTGAYYLIEINEPEADSSTWITVDKMYITNGGPGPLDPVRGFETAAGYGLRVTLRAGGSGIGATLTVFGEFPVGRG